MTGSPLTNRSKLSELTPCLEDRRRETTGQPLLEDSMVWYPPKRARNLHEQCHVYALVLPYLYVCSGCSPHHTLYLSCCEGVLGEDIAYGGFHNV